MTRKPIRGVGTVEEDSGAKNILIFGAVILGVIGLGVLLYFNIKEPSAIRGLERQAGVTRGHDENSDYTGLPLPPMGGTHHPEWQNCGIYNEPVEAKYVIHSLEHGAVWVTYDSELPADDVAELENELGGETFLIMSPYPNQVSPIVLTAWSVQLTLDDPGDSRIKEFLRQYIRGPQAPEPGASCSDGVGQPIR